MTGLMQSASEPSAERYFPSLSFRILRLRAQNTKKRRNTIWGIEDRVEIAVDLLGWGSGEYVASIAITCHGPSGAQEEGLAVLLRASAVLSAVPAATPGP